MRAVMKFPPYSPIEAVTELIHGIPVTDRYRWLENHEPPRTRSPVLPLSERIEALTAFLCDQLQLTV